MIIWMTVLLSLLSPTTNAWTPGKAIVFTRRPSLPAETLPVPLVEQGKDDSCAAAALLAVLKYWQVAEDDEKDLYRMLESNPSNETTPQRIASVAKRFRLDAIAQSSLTRDDLRKALEAGSTVILDIHPWLDERYSSHFAVLVGMDKKFLYVMDPAMEGSFGYLPASTGTTTGVLIKGSDPATRLIETRRVMQVK